MPEERKPIIKGNLTEKLLPDQCVLPEEPRPPWKGTLVQCSKLWSYLSGISTFERANMLRKGREVHKIYVEVIKGKTFLDDQFSYTEFGRMVLQNGTIRAGRAKNAKQIVVARETLYCSGSGACKRACGGYGECVAGWYGISIQLFDIWIQGLLPKNKLINCEIRTIIYLKLMLNIPGS